MVSNNTAAASGSSNSIAIIKTDIFINEDSQNRKNSLSIFQPDQLTPIIGLP